MEAKLGNMEFKAIAETFIGDTGEVYPYIKGPEIVGFFNVSIPRI